jgi:hypothetical protein
MILRKLAPIALGRSRTPLYLTLHAVMQIRERLAIQPGRKFSASLSDEVPRNPVQQLVGIISTPTGL